MTTLHCAIYEDISPTSDYVYYFFKVKKTDGSDEFLGWAKCKRERYMLQPIETGFYCTPIELAFSESMPKHIQTIWDFVPTFAFEEYSYKAEIDEYEVRIYKDGALDGAPWMTLTKDNEG